MDKMRFNNLAEQKGYGRIDAEAEREAQALAYQGRRSTDERVRQQADYNQATFNRLFVEERRC